MAIDMDIQYNTTNAGDFAVIQQYDSNDNALTVDVNGVTKPLKDINLLGHDDSFKQNVFGRLMTQNPDWFHQPNIGANLEDLFGMLNNQTSANIGISNIKRSLTYHGLTNLNKLNVKAIPVQRYKILFIITIETYDSLYVTYDYMNSTIEVVEN